MGRRKEVYISVDIEADGPIPCAYSMSSIGAVVVDDALNKTFYAELKPLPQAIPNLFAWERHGLMNGDARTVKWLLENTELDRDELIKNGEHPEAAMHRFATWLDGVCGPEEYPVFVAFNATYDWMFVYWYLVWFTGKRPFGISGWDIKAYYLGLKRLKEWQKSTKRFIRKDFKSQTPHTHNALDDAIGQAEIFRQMLWYAESRVGEEG